MKRLLLILLISLFFISSCTNISENKAPINNLRAEEVILTCSDETEYGDCSQNKPFFCENGTLIEKASVCSCPKDYLIEGEQCKKNPNCDNIGCYCIVGFRVSYIGEKNYTRPKKVYDGNCSKDKPLYCDNGVLVNKSSFCGCPSGYGRDGESCRKIICEDYTIYGYCSHDMLLYCDNGVLVNKSSLCGCPYGYGRDGESCKKMPACEDGTLYGLCSLSKPLFCKDGLLINNVSLCGCPYGMAEEGENCILTMTGNKTLKLRSGSRFITFTVYKELNDYLASLDRSISYDETEEDFVMKLLNNSEQRAFLNPLVDEIKKLTNDSDEQARIAIRLVQDISYDSSAEELKYPYEILYTESGVCGDKALLMIYLLRELGYGTAYLLFIPENHAAVGIECPEAYQYEYTGYCFVESTDIVRAGYSDLEYEGVGFLYSEPVVIVTSEGKAIGRI